MRRVIFTDLDGTLLDARTYSYEPLRPVLHRLRAAEIPVVFCSSKTRAEILRLRVELGIADPFIVENGGAIYIERDYFPFPVSEAKHRRALLAIELGAAHRSLLTALADAEGKSGCVIKRFSQLSMAQLSAVTGLSLSKARLAKQREYDEPFWFVRAKPKQKRIFLEQLRRHGLRVTHGGRLYHVKGRADKGLAVEILKDCYRRRWSSVQFIGMGDSLNDLPMLRAVDVPILVRRADGSFDRDILAALPDVLRSPAAAPEGWAASVLLLVARELHSHRASADEDKGH